MLDAEAKKKLTDQLVKCRNLIREFRTQAAREAETEIHCQLALWLGNQEERTVRAFLIVPEKEAV